MVEIIKRRRERQGEAAVLAATNEILKNGEICFETDTLRFKFGNGADHYNDLPYQPQGAVSATGDQTIDGVKTFIASPIIPAPTTNFQAATKKYVDDHSGGGSDATIATTDVTTNNVSTAKHGFAPKLPNDATKFLNGQGGYTAPGGTPGDTVPAGNSGQVQFNDAGAMGALPGSSFTGSELVLGPGQVKVSEDSQADFAAGTLTNTQANSNDSLSLANAADGTTKSVRFEGSRSNKILIPHNAAYNLTGDLTIEAWVNLENPVAFSPILAKGQALGAFDFIIQSGGGSYGWLRFGQGGSYAGTESVATVRLNQWQHVAVTKSGTTVKFYINGTLVKTDTLSVTVPTNTLDLTIGHIADAVVTAGYIFRGSLFDVRLWNSARSAAEILANMNTLSSGTPLGRWAMQEGSGTTIADTGSGGHNGTLSGSDYAWQTVSADYATSGTRVSPAYDISGAGTISSSLISWKEVKPTGHTVTVETRYSTNGGSSYSSYAACTNGVAIPGLNTTVDLSNGRLQIRQTFGSPTSKATPSISDLEAAFVTPAFEYAVGVGNDTPVADLDLGQRIIQARVYDVGGHVFNPCAPRYGADPTGVVPADTAFRALFDDLGLDRDFVNSTGKIVLPKKLYFEQDLEWNHVVVVEGLGCDNSAPGTNIVFADGKRMLLPAAEVMGGYGTGQGAGKGSIFRDFRITTLGKTNVPSSTVNISGLAITRTAGSLFKAERWGANTMVKINGFYARIADWITDTTATLKPLYFKGVVSGSTITLLFGNPFPAGLTGVSVKIDGNSYTLHASTASTATVLTLSSSPTQTGVRDIEIMSLGTLTGATMNIQSIHGFEMSGTAHLQNITVSGFAGNGIDISTANYNQENARNNNTFSLINILSIDNEGHGLHTFGNNANASAITMLNAFNNRGCGLIEASQFGNAYHMIHADANGIHPVHCENPSSINGIYTEGDQAACRLKHESGSGTGGPTGFFTFNGAGVTYDTDAAIYNCDGRVSGLHSIQILDNAGGIFSGSPINLTFAGKRRIAFGYGVAGATESATVEQVSGGLLITTNLDSDLLTPTDATKSSWKLFVPNGVVDEFRLSRAPAGSTTFVDFFKIDVTGLASLVGPLKTDKYLAIKDGLTAPGAGTGEARIYVDIADGDLKVVFADGTIKTIVVDT